MRLWSRFFWLVLLQTSALSLSMSALADGDVRGTVELLPAAAIDLGPGYRVKTKKPITPPDLPLAVIYLTRADQSYPAITAATTSTTSISQEGYQFRPGISIVRTGTQISFPNRDDEFHNVFSYSRTKRFDLGRFRKDEQSPLVTFDQPGLVKIYCEIHKHMRSLLLVVDTPWFANTDTEGRFEIKSVPAGQYSLHGLLPSEATFEQTIEVVDGQVTEVVLTP